MRARPKKPRLNSPLRLYDLPLKKRKYCPDHKQEDRCYLKGNKSFFGRREL